MDTHGTPTRKQLPSFGMAWEGAQWQRQSVMTCMLCKSVRPDIVIVQLGTNDLSSRPPLLVGSDLEDFVRLLHDWCGVQFVCVCQTIRRRSATSFNKKLDILTRYPRVVLEPIPYAIYWSHSGFWKACYNFLASDGVHLNSRGNINFIAALEGQYSSRCGRRLRSLSRWVLFCCFASSFDCCQALFVWTFDFIICFASRFLRLPLLYTIFYISLCQPLILLFVLPLAFCAGHWLPLILYFMLSLAFVQDTGCIQFFLYFIVSAFDFIICFSSRLLRGPLAVHCLYMTIGFGIILHMCSQMLFECTTHIRPPFQVRPLHSAFCTYLSYFLV